MKKKYIPNILSVIRLGCSALMVFIFARGSHAGALIIYGAAMATDFLDGWLARKFGWITDAGKLLDPLADKLLQLCAIFCLKAANIISWFPVAIMLAKEAVMIVGASLLLTRKKRVVHSNWVGKLATVVFAAAVVFAFLHAWTSPWYHYVMTAAVLLSVVSFVQYGVIDVILPSVREKRENRPA